MISTNNASSLIQALAVIYAARNNATHPITHANARVDGMTGVAAGRLADIEGKGGVGFLAALEAPEL